MKEQIKEKIKQTFDFTKTQAKQIAELSQLRIKALDLSYDIKREYKNLGEIVYECRMSNFNGEDAINASIEEIAFLRKQLTEIKKQIDFILNKTQNQDDEEINSIKEEIESIRRDINNLTGQ